MLRRDDPLYEESVSIANKLFTDKGFDPISFFYVANPSSEKEIRELSYSYLMGYLDKYSVSYKAISTFPFLFGEDPSTEFTETHILPCISTFLRKTNFSEMSALDSKLKELVAKYEILDNNSKQLSVFMDNDFIDEYVKDVDAFIVLLRFLQINSPDMFSSIVTDDRFKTRIKWIAENAYRDENTAFLMSRIDGFDFYIPTPEFKLDKKKYKMYGDVISRVVRLKPELMNQLIKDGHLGILLVLRNFASITKLSQDDAKEIIEKCSENENIGMLESKYDFIASNREFFAPIFESIKKEKPSTKLMKLDVSTPKGSKKLAFDTELAMSVLCGFSIAPNSVSTAHMARVLDSINKLESKEQISKEDQARISDGISSCINYLLKSDTPYPAHFSALARLLLKLDDPDSVAVKIEVPDGNKEAFYRNFVCKILAFPEKFPMFINKYSASESFVENMLQFIPVVMGFFEMMDTKGKSAFISNSKFPTKKFFKIMRKRSINEIVELWDALKKKKGFYSLLFGCIKDIDQLSKIPGITQDQLDAIRKKKNPMEEAKKLILQL